MKTLQFGAMACLMFLGNLFAATTINPKVFLEKRKDTWCFVHTAEKKNTAFSIAQKFGLSVNELVEQNPEIERNLPIGTKVYVTVLAVKTLDNLLFTHLVKPYETLFGISRLYSMSSDDLQKFNKLKTNTVKVGQELYLPLSMLANLTSVKEDNYILHRVKAGETLYSIAKKYNLPLDSLKQINHLTQETVQLDSALKIPKMAFLSAPQEVSIDKVEELPTEKTHFDFIDGKLSIALVLPLKLDKNKKFTQDPRNNTQKVYGDTEVALKVYQGVQMALDSLSKKGLEYELFVLDTKSDTNEIKTFEERYNIKQFDLVLAPLDGVELDAVNNLFRVHGTPVVYFPTQASQYISTKFLPARSVSLYANDSLYNQSILKYVEEHFTLPNIILVGRTEKIEEFQINHAQEAFDFFQNNAKETTELHLTEYPDKDMAKIAEALRADKDNLIFFMERDLVWVSRFSTDLQRLRNQGFRDYKFTVLGYDTWLASTEYTEEELKFEFNWHVFSTCFVDYQNAQVQKFIRSFRKKYNQDPEDLAMRSFDVTWFLGQSLLKYKEEAFTQWFNVNINGLVQQIFLQGSADGSFSNQALQLIVHEKDKAGVLRQRVIKLNDYVKPTKNPKGS